MNPPSKLDTASGKNADSRTFLVLLGRVRLLSNPFLRGFQGSVGASLSHFRSNLWTDLVGWRSCATLILGLRRSTERTLPENRNCMIEREVSASRA